MPTSSPPRGPGRPPRSAEVRAAQRTRLIDAAMAAIRAHGPDVSVDEIAAEAGVSKPVLYAEFGDKVGIGEAIAVELGDRGERVVVEEISRAGGLEMRRALTVAINRFIDIVIDEPEIYAFILRSIRTSDKGLLDNALIRTLEGRFQQLAKVLAPAADPELVHVVARAVLIAPSEMIDVGDLALRPRDAGPRVEDMTLDAAERYLIERALAVHHGNVAAAAVALGVSRSALYRRLASLGIRAHA